MQSVSSRIWTRVAVSISYDDNHYTTGRYAVIINQSIPNWNLTIKCYLILYKKQKSKIKREETAELNVYWNLENENDSRQYKMHLLKR